MELSQLNCFLAVARERSFTRAAKACNMTQPSLSYQIAKLEEELGELLFLRKPRRVELSEAGKTLLDGAMTIVTEQQRLLAVFRQREGLTEGEVRFGVIPTVAPYLLPPLLSRFRGEYPAIGIVARESRTSQLLKEVVAEDLEFAIVSDVEASLLKRYSLHLARLFDERLVLATPREHPLGAYGSIAPEKIQESELILLSEGHCLRDQIVALCRSEKRVTSLVCEQLPTQLAMVGAGLGLAVVPEMAVRGASRQDVCFVPFAEPAPSRLIGLLKKRGRKLGMAAAAFVKQLQAEVGEVAGA